MRKERIEVENVRALSPLEEKIIEFLENRGKATVSEISKSTGIKLPSVAATIDRLVSAGYVDKKKEKIEGRLRYVYYLKLTREDINRKFVERILDRIMENFGEIVAEYFHKKGFK